MKLSREELKDISAGVSLSEYFLLLQNFIAKVIAFINALLNPTSGGGSGGSGDGGGGNGTGGGGTGGGGGH